MRQRPLDALARPVSAGHRARQDFVAKEPITDNSKFGEFGIAMPLPDWGCARCDFERFCDTRS
jgi:hypothetical protein